MKYGISLVIFFCLFLTSPSSAGIYRYVDENGIIHFTNCPRDPKFKLYIRESKDDVGDDSNPSAFSYIKDSNQFDSLIAEFSKKYQVEFALIKAMIRTESGFNPLAVSRKGAKGLMQLMPETAQRVNVSNIFNPRENIEGGCVILSIFSLSLIMIFDSPWRHTMPGRTSLPSYVRSRPTGKLSITSRKC